MTDGLLPWGILVSARAVVGSGLPFRITDCSGGFNTCFVRTGDGHTYRQFDLGIGKAFGVVYGKLAFRADIINLFNTVNYTGGYDGFVPPEGNAHLGVPDGSSIGPMRTLKLSARYSF